ncbi:MAG: EF-Tu/IF-2/RF-3 family GTPase, partial [Cyanobacteria bacterium J06648_11]
ETVDESLRALIFDSYYDPYRGAIVYFRVMDGAMNAKDKVHFMSSGRDFEIDDLGVLKPHQVSVDELHAGEVGYLSAAIKSVADARVGDTITLTSTKAPEPWPGYTEAKPMVFCGLFPTNTEQFPELREALDKLKLNDAALQYEPETSGAMGFGFRCGFLGLLHMEIVQERLEREYNLDLIVTAPSVIYKVTCNDGTVLDIDNPSELPSPNERTKIEEPIVRVEIIIPEEFVGAMMELCETRRGTFKDMRYLTQGRTTLIYEVPLAEVVTDFFDQMKSRSRGYASMDYQLIEYREDRLVRLDVLIASEPVDALSTIVHIDKAYNVGRSSRYSISW